MSHDSAVHTALTSIQRQDPSLWSGATAEDDEWNACRTLSFVTFTAAPLLSSARHIALFHNGTYVGTATKDPQSQPPAVHEVSQTKLVVNYHYPLPGQSEAESTGSAQATFTWSDSAHRVIMSGSLPPQS